MARAALASKPFAVALLRCVLEAVSVSRRVSRCLARWMARGRHARALLDGTSRGRIQGARHNQAFPSELGPDERVR